MLKGAQRNSTGLELSRKEFSRGNCSEGSYLQVNHLGGDCPEEIVLSTQGELYIDCIIIFSTGAVTAMDKGSGI